MQLFREKGNVEFSSLSPEYNLLIEFFKLSTIHPQKESGNVRKNIEGYFRLKSLIQWSYKLISE